MQRQDVQHLACAIGGSVPHGHPALCRCVRVQVGPEGRLLLNHKPRPFLLCLLAKSYDSQCAPALARVGEGAVPSVGLAEESAAVASVPQDSPLLVVLDCLAYHCIALLWLRFCVRPHRNWRQHLAFGIRGCDFL